MCARNDGWPKSTSELAASGSESFVGGANEGGGFVENDREGHVAEHAFEFPFVLESVEERAFLNFAENFDGNTAGDVNAAECENFQSEITGFGTIYGGPKIESIAADQAGLIEAAAGDFGRGIGIGIFKGGVLYVWRQEFMDGAKTAAREDKFPTDLRIATAHEAEKFDLLLGVRGEIGVAPLGRDNVIAASVPYQDGLAEASARGEQSASSAGFGLTWIEDAEIFGGKMLKAMAGGAEIIEENNFFDLEFFFQIFGVDDPGKIGGANFVVNDGTGNAEARSGYALAVEMSPSLAGEFFNDEIKSREFLAGETLLENWRELAPFFREQSNIALCAADVARKNHSNLSL
jgi:hypothetical protein